MTDTSTGRNAPAKSEELREIDKLRAAVEMLTTGGMIEVAIRNPNVNEYMHHWERRAEKAEAERDALRAENERLRGLFRRISWVLSPERSETEAVACNFARAALEGVNPAPPQQGD